MIHWAMSRIMLRRLAGVVRWHASKHGQEWGFEAYCKTVSERLISKYA